MQVLTFSYNPITELISDMRNQIRKISLIVVLLKHRNFTEGYIHYYGPQFGCFYLFINFERLLIHFK